MLERLRKEGERLGRGVDWLIREGILSIEGRREREFGFYWGEGVDGWREVGEKEDMKSIGREMNGWIEGGGGRDSVDG